MNARRAIGAVVAIALGLQISVSAGDPSAAEKLTLPMDKRPEWLRRDGIVMAGSWEPLLFRVRRDGAEGYRRPRAARGQICDGTEMIARLKSSAEFCDDSLLQGWGLEAERQSMADAAAFERRRRSSGCHTHSGRSWELFSRRCRTPRIGWC